MDERQPKILELRGIGWQWSAIGSYFGISRARAHQIGSGYRATQLKKYREEILERDNNTCQWQQLCGGQNENVVIHHIDFDDNNNELDNLITLCRSCHKYFHSKFHVDIDKEEILQNGHWYNTRLVKKLCKNCGKEIEITPSQLKQFCDIKCRKDHTNKKFTKQCSGCGKVFIVSKGSRHNYYRNHRKYEGKSYCSRKCFNSTVRRVDN